MAFNTGITIIPIALKGAYEAQNKNDWRIKPGKIKAIFGEPIDKNHYANMSIDELSIKVKIEIQKMLDG